jgi:hypothetical protein
MPDIDRGLPIPIAFDREYQQISPILKINPWNTTCIWWFRLEVCRAGFAGIGMAQLGMGKR